MADRPWFVEADIPSLLKEHYGIQGVTKVEQYASYDDQVFHVTTHPTPDTSAAGHHLTLCHFIFKVARPTEDADILDLENSAMNYLSSSSEDPLAQRVLPSLTGSSIVSLKSSKGQMHLARLLTYLDGELLSSKRQKSSFLLRSLGSFLGRMDRTLLPLQHPAAPTRHLLWDFARVMELAPYVCHISTAAHRSLVRKHLRWYELFVKPNLPRLRRSIIHNDANDFNVLIRPSSSVPGEFEVSGAIDFGDCLHTYTVADLAIGAAYAVFGVQDVMSALCSIVAGYHQQLPLTDIELSLLYHLICTRLCMSVLYSSYRSSLEPTNDYILVSQQDAWCLLEYLDAIQPKVAEYTFRHACGLTPCPNSLEITNLLNSYGFGIRSILPQGLLNKVAILDFGPDSVVIKGVPLSDVAGLTQRVFSYIESAGAMVGIGKYNEKRVIYTSDSYLVPQAQTSTEPLETGVSPSADMRNVHLGIDLFVPAETELLAPLDGIIHSFKNNATELDYGPTIILRHDLMGVTFYTLYGHLSEDSLEGLQVGDSIQKGTAFAKVGNYPVNGNWPPHVHFQLMADMCGWVGDFPGVASEATRDVWLSISPDPNLILRLDALCEDGNSFSDRKEKLKQGILSLREKHFGKNLSISYAQHLHIVRGCRQYLYDENNRPYLDGVNNVCHVGHSHPRVVRALSLQASILNTNTRYLHEHIVTYASRLLSLFHPSLCVCFFVCSGSEANELALRLAQTHTKQKDIIVVDQGYHGNTNALIDISPYKFNNKGGAGKKDHVHIAVSPDTYRGKYGASEPNVGKLFAEDVKVFTDTLQAQGKGPAAFIAESVLGCAGQLVLPAGYLESCYEHTRKAGGVCIADEVQVGFGRVGSHFWGFETQGVVPDIVTLGKPIGNGHPIGAVVTTRAIADSFANGMEYFNTFGGNPVSCAVGLSVLDVIQDEQLQQNAFHVGNRIMDGLRSLMNRHDLIGDVRGLGLYIGAELVRNRLTKEPADREASLVVEQLKDRGILISTDGPFHNVLKIKPPLCFSADNADSFISALDAILESMKS